MKELLTILSLIFSLIHVNAQSIRDSVFNDVISINHTDVTTDGTFFLVNLPITSQKKPLIIYNYDERIPTRLFFNRNTFLAQQDELILITTDWQYYRNIKKNQEIRPGLKLDPVIQNKIYHIKRNGENSMVDSLTIIRDNPSRPVIINYKKPELEAQEEIVYYIDCYGSTCCPKSKSWDFYDKKNELFKNFNQENQVNIHHNSYKKINGKEGEHCMYYTLSDLSEQQRFNFIKQFIFSNKTISPHIILPNIIDTHHMKHYTTTTN